MRDLTAELEKVKWNNIADTFVVFDLETTGLDHRRDRVLEIGAVLFDKADYLLTGELTTFQCFVKQSKPIPPEATAINGITDEMVRNGEEEYRALELFFDFVGNNDLYAYNAKFDKSFMNAMAKRCRYSSEPVVEDAFDIYGHIKEAYVIKPNYKLTTVAKHLKIESSNAHRAVGDAVLALRSYIHVVQAVNMIERKKAIDHEDWCRENLSIYRDQTSNTTQMDGAPVAEPTQNSNSPLAILVAILFIISIFVVLLKSN
jgi:DNA polymerase III epsilon subunit family exonuclease